MSHFHDPYRPASLIPNRTIPGPALPTGRMGRLATPAWTVAIYQEWWDRIDDRRHQAEAAAAIAVLNDAEFGQQIAGVTALDNAPVNTVLRWVRDQPDRATAVSLALVVEDQREKPRPSVYEGLAAIK